MTVESVLAHGLKTSVFGSQWNVEYAANLALLDPDRIQSDLLANRPAFGVARRFFFATDALKLYYDTGTAWVEQSAATGAHAASHAAGGADPVTLAQSQVTNLAADLAGKEAANANIQAHIASAANPHAVTKTQAGLGNVDNTSDAGKPVSSAQQTALNLKANDNAVPHLTGNESIGGVKTFTSAVIASKGATLTPASNVLTLDSAGNYYTVAAGAFSSIATTGGSSATGARTAAGVARDVILAFEGAALITAGAALRMPGADAVGTNYGANITTYPGLVLRFREESANNWRCIDGNTLFGDYGSADFADTVFTPSGTSSLENVTAAGTPFAFTPKFTGVYEVDWMGHCVPATTGDELNFAVDASAGSPVVIRKAVLYFYTGSLIRASSSVKTIFSLTAGTAYTFNLQVRNLSAARNVNVGSVNGSAATKWFIKRIA